MEFDDLDDLVEKLSEFGNDKALWGEGIRVKAPDGTVLTGFRWDGNTSLIFTSEDEDD